MDALRRSVETERAGGERRKPTARDHRAPNRKLARFQCTGKEGELSAPNSDVLSDSEVVDTIPRLPSYMRAWCIPDILKE